MRNDRNAGHRGLVWALAALLAAALAGTPGALIAQPTPAGNGAGRATAPGAVAGEHDWARLTPAQRRVLAPLERDWPTFEPERRSKWLEIAARYSKLPLAEQQRVKDRMTEWARMTPDERTRARLSYQEAKKLSTRERQATWEAYKSLTDSERKALANRSAQPVPKALPARASAPEMVAVPKQNLVPGKPKPVTSPLPLATGVVQAKPGATTTPINKPPLPPAHQQPGQPKIAARPGQVDRATLLPRAPAAAESASAAPRRP